jgi:hypothetical protein
MLNKSNIDIKTILISIAPMKLQTIQKYISVIEFNINNFLNKIGMFHVKHSL